MANFDPFENEFRQRASSLRRTPSPKAWNRLENRLDRKGSSGGGAILGLRPWMIAAIFLLVVGMVGLSVLEQPSASPLAQRAQTIEDLDNAFAPSENFDAETFRNHLEELGQEETTEDGHTKEFRDVVIAKKYRS